MNNKYGRKMSKAGMSNIKHGNTEMVNCSRIFNNGIHQKREYERIESELSVYQIKRMLYEVGSKLYDDLYTIEAMLETGRNLSFRELQYIFDILDSKEKLVKRFEEFEQYIRKNITEIRTEKDIKRIKRLYKID